MKEQYFEAEMDVMAFSAEDIINTSDTFTWPTTTEHYNPNCENEGPTGDSFL